MFTDRPFFNQLTGDARTVALERGLKEIPISLTYADENVVAVAIGVSGEGVVAY